MTSVSIHIHVNMNSSEEDNFQNGIHHKRVVLDRDCDHGGCGV